MSVKLSTDLITIATIKKLKEKKEKFACLTAYEATLAEKISNSGVEIILVGDSLGMVIQGNDSTLPVTMDHLIYHLKCVEKGNADAQYNLGILYRLGIGVSQDFQESLNWYKLASIQGHTAAQNNLSLLYEEGIATRQDILDAIKFYRCGN